MDFNVENCECKYNKIICLYPLKYEIKFEAFENLKISPAYHNYTNCTLMGTATFIVLSQLYFV